MDIVLATSIARDKPTVQRKITPKHGDDLPQDTISKPKFCGW
jgi:hypothetical protein